MNPIHLLLLITLSNLPLRPQVPDPAVDLAWKVLSNRGTADSFGQRVADNYFAVEIHLGNNSGHDLLLSGFYFLPPNSPHPQPLEPNDPYAMVRGTIERDQQIGRRALWMYAVRSFGPLLSLGGALISGSAVTIAKYGSGVGIFSNGIEKGLDHAYPDQTIRQLSRLEANSFHDNLVLRQNEPKRILVFVNRETVQCSSTKKNPIACLGQLPYSRDFNPNEIKLRLGSLQLAGHSIEYRNRIRIETEAAVDKP